MTTNVILKAAAHRIDLESAALLDATIMTMRNIGYTPEELGRNLMLSLTQKGMPRNYAQAIVNNWLEGKTLVAVKL